MSVSINQSVNNGLLKDGKMHLRTCLRKKVQNTEYMTMYDKIKSVQIGEFDMVE